MTRLTLKKKKKGKRFCRGFGLSILQGKKWEVEDVDCVPAKKINEAWKIIIIIIINYILRRCVVWRKEKEKRIGGSTWLFSKEWI